MLSAVAWATAPPPAHHVARGALPRLPPPAAVGKGKAAPGPRRWRGRRPAPPPRPPSPWPDDARGPRRAPRLCVTPAPKEHPSPPAWPQPPARRGCCSGTPTTVEPALPGGRGHALRSDRRRRVLTSYLRRRVKRQQEERLREQSLRALELEPLHYEGYGGSPPGIAIPHRLRLEPHHHHPHHIPPPRPWSCRHESDLSKPPCYEEALLMAEPPPPYSEVLMDTRGLYRKINAPFLSHERLEKQEQPPSYKPLFLDAGYGSSLHLPRSASPGPACPDLYLQAECSPRMFPSWTDSELSSRDTYEPGPWHLPVSMPLFGRTTAV
ncbi:proline-rich protein 7 isoform X2 [Pezoporus wallicus]|uniref:proline-rich protein 7 isoform X2 n=1 Tax=Pezoporus wallicus TaxID=35540 RepID=UPI00254A9ED8|nr:proline-rich protein 7 isoform X2 [Pezoporus wallicus]